MGLYDTVMVTCPQCATVTDFQSKSGSCKLKTYTLDEAPDDVLLDINRHSPATCEKCGMRFGVKIVRCGRGQLIARAVAWCSDASADHPLNQAIREEIVVCADAPGGDDVDAIARVQAVCAAVPIGDLRTAIEVHRTNCTKAHCPVLAAMEIVLAARSSKAPSP